mmetsp:Transcript_36758/g.117023  ORF Transcript_36758/g.117023 Transcript_36758/m.117023 type:complete len:255 (-) Transcript_36758:897-1661(-)
MRWHEERGGAAGQQGAHARLARLVQHGRARVPHVGVRAVVGLVLRERLPRHHRETRHEERSDHSQVEAVAQAPRRRAYPALLDRCRASPLPPAIRCILTRRSTGGRPHRQLLLPLGRWLDLRRRRRCRQFAHARHWRDGQRCPQHVPDAGVSLLLEQDGHQACHHQQQVEQPGAGRRGGRAGVLGARRRRQLPQRPEQPAEQRGQPALVARPAAPHLVCRQKPRVDRVARGERCVPRAGMRVLHHSLDAPHRLG